MNPTILVTGGAGYIGSHTVRLLRESGYNVVVLDNLVYGHREAILEEEIACYEGDIGDQELVRHIFRTHFIEAVVHFAAYALVGESVTHPEKYYYNNVVASLNLLQVMREFGCKRFIFSSTCATYGNPQYMPIDENHPQLPINSYGSSKLMLEMMVKDYARAYDFQYIFLRYFNASGAWEDGSIGEDHTPETHLIPLIFEAIKGQRPYISVFGTDYPTHDGTCVRDYIHVLDLAQAHILAIQHLINGGNSEAINLGTGTGNSVKEVIEACKRVIGLDVPVQYADRREGDPAVLVANNQKARSVLSWQPRFQQIDDIIRTAWNWSNGPKGGRY